MVERRSILLHGLFLTLRRLPAFLWTYVLNLTLAFLFSISVNRQLASLLDHSLAAQRLSNGFDLGIISEIFLHLHEGPIQNTNTAVSHGSVPLYLILYFLLVPGTLFCYLTSAPARISTLFHQGLLHFWRFARITLLAFVVSVLILGPLFFFQGKWSNYIDDHLVGRTAFFCTLAGYIIIFLVASILRLYFDLVEVYTVQLGLNLRPAIFGSQPKQDRRVRVALSPAWRTLRSHFSQAWPVFLFLTLTGASAVILTARIAMHMLAQPRVWPTFLLAQLGLFLMLFTRFWQRGAETSLALQNPLVDPTLQATLPVANIVSPTANPIAPVPTRLNLTPELHSRTPEPIANPEPAPPSLDEPDPGVFHHDPSKPSD